MLATKLILVLESPFFRWDELLVKTQTAFGSHAEETQNFLETPDCIFHPNFEKKLSLNKKAFGCLDSWCEIYAKNVNWGYQEASLTGK